MPTQRERAQPRCVKSATTRWQIYTSGCTGGTLLLHCACSINHNTGCSQPTAVVSEDSCAYPPADRRSDVVALLLGVAVSLPVTASDAAAQTRPKSSKTTTSTTKKPVKRSYSASSSQRPEEPASPAPAPPPAPAKPPGCGQLQEAMTPRFKTDADRPGRPRRPRRRRHHLQPRDRGGPLAGELAGQAVDRQHHQGDDRAGLPRGQSRSQRRRSRSSAATPTPPRRPTCARTSGSSLNDLLHLMLIASDNAAARALARVSHGGTASFVERMNEKAIELGLENTTFADPSGPERRQHVVGLRPVAPDHVSPSSDEIISPIMRTPNYTATVGRRQIPIHSTNRLCGTATST